MKLYNSKEYKTLRRKLRNEMTTAERLLWYQIRARRIKGYKFRRQVSIGNYIVDFYCPEAKLVIEVDGDSHFDPKTEIKDEERNRILSDYGLRCIRFTNLDVIKNIEEVVPIIMKMLPDR